MAIRPKDIYPGQVDLSSPYFPLGRARNVAAIGDGSGTPLEESWVSDLWGWQQALLAEANIVASGSPDNLAASQYLSAIKIIADVRANRMVQHRAMAFTKTDLGTTGLTLLSAMQQTQAVGTAANREQQILASGTSSGIAVAALLNDGTVTASTNSLAGAAMLSAPATDSAGAMFVGITGSGVVKSTTGGGSPSSVTVTGLSVDAAWVGATTSHYLVFAFQSGAGTIFKASSLGGSWASQTITATNASDLSTNGAGVWVLTCANASSQRAYYSTDDGVTWTLGSTFGTASTASGCYSADAGLFFVLTSTGQLWSSPNGSAWTLSKTVSGLSGLTLGQNKMVACGPALAVVVNRGPNAVGKYPCGIAYTLDKGANWNETYFGAPSGTVPITNLLSANGRILATDGAALYRSGIMQIPASLYAGV